MEEEIKLLIGKSEDKDVLIDAQDLVTGRTCVIGQSGSGKSYLVAVLCEKLLENNISFCIVDTEGEYFSLKEKYDVLWVGGKSSDVDIEATDLLDLARKVVESNVPVIFDVSDVLEERDYVSRFSKALYDICTHLRTPYLLIVEEADKFVPQSKNSLKEIEEISKRGRKRGLGLLVATQRPSLVNKNVLSQCGNQFIGKLTTENDLSAVDLFFVDRKELELLPKLKVGEFFMMGNLSQEKTKIKSVQRATKHKGLTPKLVKKEAGKITELKASLGIVEKPSEIRPEPMKATGDLGIQPKVSKDIQKLIEPKRKRKYMLFGEKEHLQSLEMEYVPLAWVEITSKEGIIKKKFKTHSFLIDGLVGDFVSIDNGLSYRKGFRDLIGMSENEVKVILGLSKGRKTTADLEVDVGLSEMTIRKLVSSLQDRKLVTFNRKGRVKYYSLLFKFDRPNIKQNVDMPAVASISGKLIKPRLDEKDLRNIVKAMDDNADITKFETLYYPIWKVRLDSREIRIDGVTGKEIR